MPKSKVYSVRLSAEHAELLERKAFAAGVKPSELLRDFAAAPLAPPDDAPPDDAPPDDAPE